MRTLYCILILFFASSSNLVHSQSMSVMNSQTAGCSGILRQAILGSMGAGGLIIADVENDGSAEMLCSATEGEEYFWYLLSYNAATASYLPVYVSGLYGDERISALAAFDVDSDGVMEILIGKN